MGELPKIPPDQRHEWALRLILIEFGFRCEHSTVPVIGQCHRNGRTPDAEYGADRWCHACLAHFALHGGFPDTISSEAVR